MFGATNEALPSADVYIQAQMEQASTHHFNDKYKSKLNGAVQVWELSPAFRRTAPVFSSPGYYVPTMLMLASDPPVFNCPAPAGSERAAVVPVVPVVPAAAAVPIVATANAVEAARLREIQQKLLAERRTRKGGKDFDKKLEAIVNDLAWDDSGKGRRRSLRVTAKQKSQKEGKDGGEKKKTKTDKEAGGLIKSGKKNTKNTDSARSSSSCAVAIPTAVPVAPVPAVDQGPRYPPGQFRLYRGGWYRTCLVDSEGRPSNGGVQLAEGCTTARSHNINFWDNSTSVDFDPDSQVCIADDKAPINSDANECKRVLEQSAPVLMYGKIEGVAGNRRQLLCDRLHTHVSGGVGAGARGHPVVCLHGVFGKQLEHFVCRAKIVVVEHSFDRSFLETHRIDPLLQAGKIIVVSPSFDLFLQDMYRKVLLVTPRVDMVRQVQYVLGRPNIGHLSHRQKRGLNFMHQQSNTVDPLCYALRNLQEDVNAQRHAKHSAVDNDHSVFEITLG
jgi:hypothetical protein